MRIFDVLPRPGSGERRRATEQEAPEPVKAMQPRTWESMAMIAWSAAYVAHTPLLARADASYKLARGAWRKNGVGINIPRSPTIRLLASSGLEWGLMIDVLRGGQWLMFYMNEQSAQQRPRGEG